MSTETQVVSTTLYYREGSSDKVYMAAINEVDGGYTVTFAYGRRGTTLTPGTKTQAPVSLAEAEKIHDKLLNSKRAKGYTEGEAGTPYVGGDKERRATGIHCQLLNEIEEDEVERYLVDDGWGMQEKYDGHRVPLDATLESVRGINRSGLERGIPQTIEQAIRDLAGVVSLYNDVAAITPDGELMGERYVLFDLMRFGAEDVKPNPFKARYNALFSLRAAIQPPLILAPLYVGEQAKREAFARIQAAGREGVVFKDLNAPYTPGRPNSGGAQLKFCFLHTISAVVSKRNQKRSVGVRLFIDGAWREMGNVTIPPNVDIPEVGQIVDVRYKYAYRGGKLYQPNYQGPREDVTLADIEAQREPHYKPEEEE